MPYLAQALDDEDRTVRTNAAQQLIKFGPDAEMAVPALIRVLESASPLGGEIMSYSPDSEIVRSRELIDNCVKALKKIGPGAADAVPVLTGLMATVRHELKKDVIWALACIGEPAAATIPKIADMLSDDHPDFRAATAHALGIFGPLAAESVSKLIPLLRDEDPSVRWNAADALGKIGPVASDALASLQNIARNDPNAEVRKAAEEAIGKIEGFKENV